MRDNASRDWSSWSVQGPQADTRHWNPPEADSWGGQFEAMNQEWLQHLTLRALEQMLRDDPEMARAIIQERSGSAQMLRDRNNKHAARLTAAAGSSKDGKKGFADRDSINAAVRNLLNSGNK
jgi:hypothetical protein